MPKISWWRTNFGESELNLIANALAHEHISQGPVTAAFEAELAKVLGVSFVVATTSGSIAILMALIAAGVGPGDEVIVPNRTWIATAHAPLLLGAKVVLVDVQTDRPIMDTALIESKITSRTKVIIPVHLNGRSVNMQEIKRIASHNNLTVIEDAAQALCSKNINGMLGCQSFAGCFSLGLTKIISTGQGGFVVTNNQQTYERLNLMRTHGIPDLIDSTYTQPGFNFRITDIQSSIGIAQLKRLSNRIEKLKTIYNIYENAIKSLPFLKIIPVDLDAGEIPIYIEVLCARRTDLIRFLANHGVQTRPFYPNLHAATYFKNDSEFPNSSVFAEQGLFLPCGPEQPLKNIEYVIDILRKFDGT